MQSLLSMINVAMSQTYRGVYIIINYCLRIFSVNTRNFPICNNELPKPRNKNELDLYIYTYIK